MTIVALLVPMACAAAQPPSAGSRAPSAASAAPGASPASSGASLVTARAAVVAPEHRYVAASEGERGHILLIDLATGASVQVVSARGSSGKPYFLPPFSESADGGRLLVGATGPAARSALYLVDVVGVASPCSTRTTRSGPSVRCTA